MPTYSYTCKNCTHSFDIRQAFSDPSLTTCPECGGRLKKNFGTVGISFKGSGFYHNDSRDSSTSGSHKKTAAPAAEATTGTGDSGSSSASSDSASSDSSDSSSAKPAASSAPAAG